MADLINFAAAFVLAGGGCLWGAMLISAAYTEGVGWVAKQPGAWVAATCVACLFMGALSLMGAL